MAAEEVWTIKATLDWLAGYLERKGDDSPLLSAQWLLSEVTGLSRIELYVNHDKPLSMEERDLLRGYATRRGRGEPLQYITGEVGFRHITVKVRPGVLIPRPETEVLVSELLAALPSPEKRRSAEYLAELEALAAASAGDASVVDASVVDASVVDASVVDTTESHATNLSVPASASASTPDHSVFVHSVMDDSISDASDSVAPGASDFVRSVSGHSDLDVSVSSVSVSNASGFGVFGANGAESENENVSRETFVRAETFGKSETSASGSNVNACEVNACEVGACETNVSEVSAREMFGVKHDALLVADICTGSGCIACSIAHEHPHAHVIATDIASEALSLAEDNVIALGLEERVQVMYSDLGTAIPRGLMGEFDAIVSNPPYVPSSVMAEIPREVADFEPALALDGGEDGLDLYRPLLIWSFEALKPGGFFAAELHETCLDEAADLARKANWVDVRVVYDLAGRPRILTARKPAGV